MTKRYNPKLEVLEMLAQGLISKKELKPTPSLIVKVAPGAKVTSQRLLTVDGY